MAERKIIHIFVNLRWDGQRRITIPYDIDEVQLKAQLRDLGYIPSYRNSYLTTRVFLQTVNGDVEICTGEYRSLEELGFKEDSTIYILPGEDEPRPIYNYYEDPGSMTCLYGCPMAHSVKEAMSQAEKYTDDDSVVTTGSIESK